MRISDIKQKEIINTCTCRSLGCPSDIEFDCLTGCVTALVVSEPGRFYNIFCRDTEYVIPWKCINQIGDDIILVSLKEENFLHDHHTP